jgi:GrpB-like predicted nucleotidyltransferase (UPF0157 family)
MSKAELLEYIEKKLTEVEEKMAAAHEEENYRYYEGQLHILEVILERAEGLE